MRIEKNVASLANEVTTIAASVDREESLYIAKTSGDTDANASTSTSTTTIAGAVKLLPSPLVFVAYYPNVASIQYPIIIVSTEAAWEEALFRISQLYPNGTILGSCCPVTDNFSQIYSLLCPAHCPAPEAENA